MVQASTDPSGPDRIAQLAATTGRRVSFTLRPPAVGELPEVSGLLAGAAEVDVTPPPGLPRAGYSRSSRDGQGFRTRLRVRAIHLRAGRTALSLVAGDLLSGSAVLHGLVTADLAGTDQPPEGVLIGATHTHGAPGAFHGSDFYNRFSAGRPGFDPGWTAFLAARTAEAVRAAIGAREPATAAWGRTAVTGFTANRALEAQLRNPETALRRPADRAVNPWLDLLRVDVRVPYGGFRPLAALVVYAVHGTCVPATSRTYNGDLWSYLTDELGSGVRAAAGVRPVVAAVNGMHGDVRPARAGPAGHAEAARIGRGIGALAAALHAGLEGRLAAELPLAAALREVDLTRRPVAGGVRLPDRAAVGAALLAGGSEHRRLVARIPPFRRGTPKPFGGHGPHTAKWVLGSRWGQPLLLPPASFPRVLPVQVLRIGEVLLTALPFEMTTVSGRRVADVVAAGWTAGGGTRLRPVLTSVANEYCGYCTTEQEYAAQFYEGAHTLYGSLTQRFLAACAGELATTLARTGGVRDLLPWRCFDLAAHRFDAPGGPAPRTRPAVVREPDAAPGGPVRWRWSDAAPGELHWHEPLAGIELPGGRPARIGDGAGDVELVHLGEATGGPGHRYELTWWPDRRVTGPAVLVLAENAGQPSVAAFPLTPGGRAQT